MLEPIICHGMTTPATWQRRIASLKRIFWSVASRKVSRIYGSLPVHKNEYTTHIYEVEVALRTHWPDALWSGVKAALFLI